MNNVQNMWVILRDLKRQPVLNEDALDLWLLKNEIESLERRIDEVLKQEHLLEIHCADWQDAQDFFNDPVTVAKMKRRGLHVERMDEQAKVVYVAGRPARIKAMKRRGKWKLRTEENYELR